MANLQNSLTLTTGIRATKWLLETEAIPTARFHSQGLSFEDIVTDRYRDGDVNMSWHVNDDNCTQGVSSGARYCHHTYYLQGQVLVVCFST